MYVPDHQKWIKYYEKIGQTVHPSSVTGGERWKNQRGGSISKTTNNYIIPIESPSNTHAYKNNIGAAKSVSVNLISPSQATTNQAQSEIERMRGIKRKRKTKSKTRKITVRDKRRKKTSSTRSSRNRKTLKKKSKRSKDKKNKFKISETFYKGYIFLKKYAQAQPSELSLFDLMPTQTAVEKLYYQQVLPISQLTDSSPIQFSVKGQNGMEFIDTKNSFMSIKARIVHGFMSIKARIVHANGNFFKKYRICGPCKPAGSRFI